MATSRSPRLPEEMQMAVTKLMYVVLLAALFVIGYLVGKLEIYEKGGSITTAQAGTDTGTAAAPEAIPTPEPEEVLAALEANPSRLPIKGQESAPVTIVEFSDFECPFCASFFTGAYPQIVSEYVDTGKVKIEFRHYPLSFHPKAKPLGLAAECAHDQGSFWAMHDKIFEENAAGTLAAATDETYKQWAADLGLNASTFNSCYDAGTHNQLIDDDFALGSQVGVSGTPTFYINGKQLVGALPFESFKAIIDEELQ